MRRSEDDFVGLVLFHPYVGFWDRTQFVRFVQEASLPAEPCHQPGRDILVHTALSTLSL